MANYKLMTEQLRSLSAAAPHYMPMLSNAAAILYNGMDDLNWAGFYLMNEGSLLLGPFQGKVACVRIEIGRGVCGTAVAEDKTQLVKNVHEFPGHIACDGASNSEIVIPIHSGGKIVGVLDIDSPSLARFDEDDKIGLEGFVKALEEVTNFKAMG